jgi:hypothetical protein
MLLLLGVALGSLFSVELFQVFPVEAIGDGDHPLVEVVVAGFAAASSVNSTSQAITCQEYYFVVFLNPTSQGAMTAGPVVTHTAADMAVELTREAACASSRAMPFLLTRRS